MEEEKLNLSAQDALALSAALRLPLTDLFARIRSIAAHEEMLTPFLRQELEGVWAIRKLLSQNEENATEQLIATMARTQDNEQFLLRLKSWTAMLEKEGYPAPKVTLDGSITDFYRFTKDSFQVENYQFHPFDFEIPMAI